MKFVSYLISSSKNHLFPCPAWWFGVRIQILNTTFHGIQFYILDYKFLGTTHILIICSASRFEPWTFIYRKSVEPVLHGSLFPAVRSVEPIIYDTLSKITAWHLYAPLHTCISLQLRFAWWNHQSLALSVMCSKGQGVSQCENLWVQICATENIVT